MESLEDLFERRWQTLLKRSIKNNISPPQREQLRQLFLQAAYNPNGFRCDYCNNLLNAKDNYPYYFRPSIEHKKSIYHGGDNRIENLAVICHRCNIVKGPMSEETWRAIIKHLPPELFNQMCNESFAAGMSRELKSQGLSKEEDT